MERWFRPGALHTVARRPFGDLFGWMCEPAPAITGIGGGVLRDVLLRQIPAVLRHDLYAVPALAGAAVVVGAHGAGSNSLAVLNRASRPWGLARSEATPDRPQPLPKASQHLGLGAAKSHDSATVERTADIFEAKRKRLWLAVPELFSMDVQMWLGRPARIPDAPDDLTLLYLLPRSDLHAPRLQVGEDDPRSFGFDRHVVPDRQARLCVEGHLVRQPIEGIHHPAAARRADVTAVDHVVLKMARGEASTGPATVPEDLDDVERPALGDDLPVPIQSRAASMSDAEGAVG